MTLVFRDTIVAATLKHRDLGPPGQLADVFRDTIVAATLKPREDRPRGGRRRCFPRHHRRGHIEATSSASPPTPTARFPRHHRRGHIEADSTARRPAPRWVVFRDTIVAA